MISSRTVLTAAHCIAKKKPEDITVLIGEHDTKAKDGEVRVRVKRIIEHPDYAGDRKPFKNGKGPKYDNDFAILILSEPVKWRKEVRPICLPEGEPASYEKIPVFMFSIKTLYH